MPPSVPAERVIFMRAALGRMVQDAAFLEEARKLNLDIDVVSGEQIAGMIDRVYGIAPGHCGARARHDQRAAVMNGGVMQPSHECRITRGVEYVVHDGVRLTGDLYQPVGLEKSPAVDRGAWRWLAGEHRSALQALGSLAGGARNCAILN